MPSIAGKYQHYKNENIDDYFIAVGKFVQFFIENFLTRVERFINEQKSWNSSSSLNVFY